MARQLPSMLIGTFAVPLHISLGDWHSLQIHLNGTGKDAVNT